MVDANTGVIYCSAAGNVHRMAAAATEVAATEVAATEVAATEVTATGVADKAGAQARLRTVRESAPADAIASHERWAAHYPTVDRRRGAARCSPPAGEQHATLSSSHRRRPLDRGARPS
jgi:hypothetical protein